MTKETQLRMTSERAKEWEAEANCGGRGFTLRRTFLFHMGII